MPIIQAWVITQYASIGNGQPPANQIPAYRVTTGNGGGAIPQCHQLDAISSPLAGLRLLALTSGLFDQSAGLGALLGRLRRVATRYPNFAGTSTPAAIYSGHLAGIIKDAIPARFLQPLIFCCFAANQSASLY